MDYTNNHTYALDDLVAHLQKVNEYPDNIQWIMREGIWTPDIDNTYKVFPDLILVYNNDRAVPVELKSINYKGKHHIDQLEAGRDFIHSELNMDCDYGILARYDTQNPYLVHKFQTIKW